VRVLYTNIKDLVSWVMLLSIIIVNYKSTQYIVDCLNAATPSFIQRKDVEWIIVDNDSKDDSESILTARFPFISYMQMGYNAGFARANNAGIKAAKGEQVLLLNPDTILVPGTIEQCLERLMRSAHVACGVQLVHADLSPQFSASHFVKGGMNHLLSIPYWGATVKAMASFFIKEKPAIIEVGREQLVDWVSGAFLMVKKTAIDKAGLLDEDFFLYAEEVEWCSRLRKWGTLCVYGDLKMIHLIGTSIQDATNAADNSYTNLSDKKGLQLMVSNHVRIRKQYGVFWFLFQLLNYTWAIPYAFVMSVVLHIAHMKNPFTDCAALFGFAKNVLRLWRLTPTILRNRRHFYKCI